MSAGERTRLFGHRLGDNGLTMTQIAIKYLALEVQPSLIVPVEEPGAAASGNLHWRRRLLSGPRVENMLALTRFQRRHEHPPFAASFIDYPPVAPVGQRLCTSISFFGVPATN